MTPTSPPFLPSDSLVEHVHHPAFAQGILITGKGERHYELMLLLRSLARRARRTRVEWRKVLSRLAHADTRVSTLG